MNDPLRDRLGRLDPMAPGVPTEPMTTESSRNLLEEIMSTPVKETTPASRPARRNPWLIPVTAIAALIVAVGAATAFLGGEPVATGEPLTLSTGESDVIASCLPFSVEVLAQSPLAFEGTATSVEGDQVVLSVDRWFKGGDAGQVILRAPQGLEALIDGFAFEPGAQYLITAYDGTVNYCGFSGRATPELRSAFERAFGG